MYSLKQDPNKRRLDDLEEIHKDITAILLEYYSMELTREKLLKWKKKALISNTEHIRKFSENLKNFRPVKIKN